MKAINILIYLYFKIGKSNILIRYWPNTSKHLFINFYVVTQTFIRLLHFLDLDNCRHINGYREVQAGVSTAPSMSISVNVPFTVHVFWCTSNTIVLQLALNQPCVFMLMLLQLPWKSINQYPDINKLISAKAWH